MKYGNLRLSLPYIHNDLRIQKLNIPLNDDNNKYEKSKVSRRQKLENLSNEELEEQRDTFDEQSVKLFNEDLTKLRQSLPPPLSNSIKLSSERTNSIILPSVHNLQPRFSKTSISLASGVVTNAPRYSLYSSQQNGSNPNSFFNAYLRYRQKRHTIIEKERERINNFRSALKPVHVISRETIEKIINGILKTFLNTLYRQVHYASNEIDTIKTHLKYLSTVIKQEIKLHCDPHYRVIVTCTMGELKNQGLIIASRCLWDESKDACITVKYIHNHFFILVNAFAIYRE